MKRFRITAVKAAFEPRPLPRNGLVEQLIGWIRVICTILGKNDGELGLFKHGGFHRIYHELPHSYGKFDMLSGNNKVLNLYFGVSYSQTNVYYRTPGAALVGQAHPTIMAM